MNFKMTPIGLSALNTGLTHSISIDGTVSLQKRETSCLLPRNNDAVANLMMSCCDKHGPKNYVVPDACNLN